MYPFWMVDVALDEIYPGWVTFLRVNIWADTGEIIEIKPLGIGGGFQPGNSSLTTTPAPTTASDSDTANLPLPVYLLIAISVVIAAFAGIALKRRRK